MILQTTTAFVRCRDLTGPASSGISHAHAGLAKLRPPLTPSVFIRACSRRPLVTSVNRASRNGGQSVTTNLFHIRCGVST
jgi:hypothetical protein